MPRQSDSPEHPGTIPLPELNPLLNPVLSKNIGRWAEVYFTNPPEQREAAVQKLIRDLEREGPAPEIDPGPVHSLPPEDWTIRSAPAFKVPSVSASMAEVSADDAARLDAEDETVSCPSCRYLNRRRYKYCGRCGARLDLAPGVDLSAVNEVSRTNGRSVDFVPSRPNPEPPIFGRDLDWQSEPAWHSYRGLYLGIALVIIAFGIAYFAWTSAWVGTLTGKIKPPAPHADQQPSTTAAANEPATSTSSSSTSSTVSAPVNGETNSLRPAGTNGTDAVPTSAPTQTTPVRESDSISKSIPAAAKEKPAPSTVASASVKPAAVTTPAGATPSAAVSLGGFEELSVARHYLNDANGGSQSRAEAANWLWKSVAKQNIDATVLLSDMYLRGDGVSKNCEQARLLLDAAAIKGRKDAAEQLRHLNAFGCQ